MSSREQFEAWASDEWKFPFVVERSGDSYKFMATQNKWEVWQAATNAMEAKCAALAAENGCLKISESDLDLMCAEMSEDGWESVLTKTPATDAYLAEVRAQESKRVYESIMDNPSVTDMESLVDWLEQNANDSLAYAAQIRQEAAQ